MIKWDDVGVGKPYPPKSEASRIHAIEQNRELYDGNFRSLNLTERNAVERGGAIYDSQWACAAWSYPQLRAGERTTSFVAWQRSIRTSCSVSRCCRHDRQQHASMQFLRAIDNLLTKGAVGNECGLRCGLACQRLDHRRRAGSWLAGDRTRPVVSCGRYDAGRLIGDVTAEHVVGDAFRDLRGGSLQCGAYANERLPRGCADNERL